LNQMKPPLQGDWWVPPEWFGTAIYLIGLIAAVGTAFYMFRAYFMTFWGKFRGWKIVRGWKPSGHDHHDEPEDEPLEGPTPQESPWTMTVPLAVLAFFAFFAGFLNAHPIHSTPLGNFLEPLFAGTEKAYVIHRDVESFFWPLFAVGASAFFVGAGAAAWVYWKKHGEPARKLVERFPRFHRLVYDKWRVDEIYEATVIGMIDALGETAALFDKWVIDGILAKLTALVTRLFGTALRAVQTGRIQVYAAGMVIGTAGIGWWLLQPHADATVDDTQLRSQGTVAFTAAPGHGYSYAWHTHDESVPEEFTDERNYTLQINEKCTPKIVHLRVRNMFGQVARKSFSHCRMTGTHELKIRGCCKSKAEKKAQPSKSKPTTGPNTAANKPVRPNPRALPRGAKPKAPPGKGRQVPLRPGPAKKGGSR